MDLPPELELIHQPVRLRIMATLYRHRDVSFTRLRDLLKLTDGNLASHGDRLQKAGLLEGRRVLQSDHFEVRYRITSQGSQAFQSYLAELRRFVDGVESSAAQPPAEGERR